MALGIATGSTFAWFTSNRTVTVGAVQAQVVSGTQGLYVAIWDGSAYGNFTNALDTTAINAATNANTAVKLDALTTGTTTNGALYTEANATSTTPEAAYDKAKTTAGEQNKYLEIKLKFRTTVAQDIYLGYSATEDKDSTITAGTATLNAVAAWQQIDAATYGKSVAQGEALDTRAAYAARVSFKNGDNVKIWAPYDYSDGEGTDGLTTQNGFYKGNLARDYRNHMLGTSDAYTVASTNQVTLLEDAVAKADTNAGSATKIATTTLQNGHYEAEVTIRLWIEGTDGDCLNSIFNDTLALNMVFKTLVPAAVTPTP